MTLRARGAREVENMLLFDDYERGAYVRAGVRGVEGDMRYVARRMREVDRVLFQSDVARD